MTAGGSSVLFITTKIIKTSLRNTKTLPDLSKAKDIPCSLMEQFSIHKDLILLMLTYNFNMILRKIPDVFLEELILELIWKNQHARRAIKKAKRKGEETRLAK